jgi:hypothetical protein
MAGRRLAADDHLAMNFLNDQIANPSMRRLTNLGFNSLGQAQGRLDAITDHVANLRRSKHKIAGFFNAL